MTVAVSSGRGHEGGGTLLEAAVALGLVALAVLLPSFASRRPGALAASAGVISALLDRARGVAAASGAGATLTISPEAGGGSAVSLAPGRPTPEETVGPSVATERIPAALVAEGLGPAFAIFVSSDGAASAAAWVHGNGPLPSEPPCATDIRLRLSDGVDVVTHAVSCTLAAFR